MPLKLRNQTSQEKKPLWTARLGYYPGLTELLSTYPWLKRATFFALPMSLTIWVKGPYQTTTLRCVLFYGNPRTVQTRAEIPSWMPKHPVFSSILKQVSDGHRYSDNPLDALKPTLRNRTEQARTLTRRALLHKTPSSPGAKLLIAANAMRAYRNRHLGTPGCTVAQLGNLQQCFDVITFECVNFHGLSQIIASLTRENIAEREAAVHNLPWTQTEKEKAHWRNAD